MRKVLLIALMLGIAASGGAQESKPDVKLPPRNDFAWARLPYRLDFAIKELEDGKVVNTRNYSMVMQSSEERGRAYGSVRAGSRVPITTTNKDGQNSTTYMDVGVDITTHLYVLQSGDLLLDSNCEVSSLAAQQSTTNPILRAIRSNTTAEITAGKAAQIASMDDPNSNRRFQIEVTANKLK